MRKVIVNDRMQRGYVYHRTEPVKRSFAAGCDVPTIDDQSALSRTPLISL
jgi:hypothetical protein